MKFIGSLLAVVVCFLIPAILPANAADHGRLAKTAYEKHILPGYQKLHTDADQFEAALKTFCANPDQAKYQPVRDAYKKLLLSWSSVEHLRFGPVTQNYNYERFAYWPDIKGRGLKRVRKALKENDETVLSESYLKKKSIALQGLTALEFLLYGQKHKTIFKADDAGKFRCAFAYNIARNLSGISKDILSGWKKDTPYVDAFLNPEKGKTYVSAKEVTLVLFQAYVTSYAKYRSLKIMRPLGLPKKKRVNPRLAPYWRSGLTIDVLTANLLALKDMYLIGGFNEIVGDKDPFLKQSMKVSINNGVQILSSINEPVAVIFADERKRSKYKFIASILSVMRSHSGTAILKATDLTIGFNAEDGD